LKSNFGKFAFQTFSKKNNGFSKMLTKSFLAVPFHQIHHGNHHQPNHQPSIRIPEKIARATWASRHLKMWWGKQTLEMRHRKRA
jgi:hypothetical protein